MKNIIYPTLLFSLLIVSCNMETVIDLDIPPHEPVLVLNGILETDTNVQVVVSHSVGAFSSAVPSFINDANVLLYKNNELTSIPLLPDVENLVYVNYIDDGTADSLAMYYYKSDYIPDNNSTYRLEVNHSDYPSILAETYIPDDISLYNIDIDTISSEEKIGFTFSFDDNASQQNYYRLKLFSSCKKEWENEDGDIEELNFRGDTRFMSNDPSFPNEIPFEGYTFEGDNVVFTDALFNGQQKTITLDVISDLKYADCDTIIIQFSTFSDDTYSYYNSLGDHSEKGELSIFGGEVIPVYSNVENGLGVLISINAQQIYLKPSLE
ncbi:DUF4249 domain-containing protein [Flavobacteriales bacterium]|jgi:hypothetical protein|nr:DUF4249 domain-containing protein [Flavobacteriales bacterium]